MPSVEQREGGAYSVSRYLADIVAILEMQADCGKVA